MVAGGAGLGDIVDGAGEKRGLCVAGGRAWPTLLHGLLPQLPRPSRWSKLSQRCCLQTEGGACRRARCCCQTATLATSPSPHSLEQERRKEMNSAHKIFRPAQNAATGAQTPQSFCSLQWLHGYTRLTPGPPVDQYMGYLYTGRTHTTLPPHRPLTPRTHTHALS